MCCCTGRERRQQQGRAADCAVDRIASFEAAAEPGQDIGLRLEIKQSISSLIGWEIRYRGKTSGRRGDTKHLNSSVRTREYLTTAEIERLMAAARKSSRYGHRDATMILIGYRHGLRASELCDLQWSQVELATGRLHVRRAKNGSPSVHPMQGDEYARCGVCSANRGRPRTSL